MERIIQLNDYASIAVSSTPNCEVMAGIKLNIGKVLDEAAIKVKAAIPGTLEEPHVDSIVARLKAQISGAVVLPDADANGSK